MSDAFSLSAAFSLSSFNLSQLDTRAKKRDYCLLPNTATVLDYIFSFCSMTKQKEPPTWRTLILYSTRLFAEVFLFSYTFDSL